MRQSSPGILCTLCLGLLAGLALRPLFSSTPAEVQNRDRGDGVGRYQLVVNHPAMSQNSTILPKPYLIDTQTGRVWVHDGAAWHNLGSAVRTGDPHFPVPDSGERAPRR